MISETKVCYKCKREIPTSEMANGHQERCHGILLETEDEKITEVEVSDSSDLDTPLLFQTRSQRKDLILSPYGQQEQSRSIDTQMKIYQNKIDSLSKDVILLLP